MAKDTDPKAARDWLEEQLKAVEAKANTGPSAERYELMRYKLLYEEVLQYVNKGVMLNVAQRTGLARYFKSLANSNPRIFDVDDALIDKALEIATRINLLKA